MSCYFFILHDAFYSHLKILELAKERTKSLKMYIYFKVIVMTIDVSIVCTYEAFVLAILLIFMSKFFFVFGFLNLHGPFWQAQSASTSLHPVFDTQLF